jgi:hypothetical protein
VESRSWSKLPARNSGRVMAMRQFLKTLSRMGIAWFEVSTSLHDWRWVHIADVLMARPIQGKANSRRIERKDVVETCTYRLNDG